jgi:hypothetical protein
MKLSLTLFAFYSASHFVRGQDATSLRGRPVKDVNGNNVKNRRSRMQDHAIDRSLIAIEDSFSFSMSMREQLFDELEAVEDRFYYAVSLQYLGEHVCGGSLIARDVVLTAAHCKDFHFHSDFDSVVLGRHNLNDSDGEVLGIRGVLSHPGWNYNTLENDFMLVFLEGTPAAENVITVKLNPWHFLPYSGVQGMTAMGWGDKDPRHDSPETADIYDFHTQSDVLLNIDVGYLSDDDCGLIGFTELLDAGITWNAEVDNSMMCAKRSNGQGVCNGDSGGPLVIKGDTGAEDVQVGVVSLVSSSGCATDIPDFYARVSHAYQWIQSEVCKTSAYASEAWFDTLHWVDSYGNGCEWYEAYDSPGCPEYGMDGTDAGTAKYNCCYCMTS